MKSKWVINAGSRDVDLTGLGQYTVIVVGVATGASPATAAVLDSDLLCLVGK